MIMPTTINVNESSRPGLARLPPAAAPGARPTPFAPPAP